MPIKQNMGICGRLIDLLLFFMLFSFLNWSPKRRNKLNHSKQI